MHKHEIKSKCVSSQVKVGQSVTGAPPEVGKDCKGWVWLTFCKISKDLPLRGWTKDFLYKDAVTITASLRYKVLTRIKRNVLGSLNITSMYGVCLGKCFHCISLGLEESVEAF